MDKEKQIFEWWKSECERIEKEAKKNGTWNDSGLDSNNYLFKAINNEAKEKLKNLKTNNN